MQLLRILRNHYANELRRYTQINYANHYADYAIQLRKYDYAIPQKVITQITQIPISITQKFWSLRNGQLVDVAWVQRDWRQAWPGLQAGPRLLGRQPYGDTPWYPCFVCTILFSCTFTTSRGKRLGLGGLQLPGGPCCWWRSARDLETRNPLAALLAGIPDLNTPEVEALCNLPVPEWVTRRNI